MDEFRYFTETVAPAAAKQLYQAMGCPQTDPEETERKRTLAEQRNALCELIGCPVRYALIETPMPLLAGILRRPPTRSRVYLTVPGSYAERFCRDQGYLCETG